MILKQKVCEQLDKLKEKISVVKKSGAKISKFEFKPEIFPFIDGACKAIETLSDRGLYHLNLKPNNLLVLNNSIQLSDYGLSKITVN